jgi:4-diphosphocytidyl-2-C-methyl-D-erythritol kinase
MKRIKAKAPAKLNLTLEIVKKLPNGFHQLRSVILKSKKLFDELEIIFNEQEDRIKIICDNPAVPTDEKNICWKIAERFFAKTGKRVGLTIKIKKNIPLASGLGGGSSDGAIVLLALNTYFQNILSEKKLIALAAEVGKDIPLFLTNTDAVFISGMGEKITPLKRFLRLDLLIINPLGEISTPWAYSELDKELIFMNDQKRQTFSEKFVKNSSDLRKMSQYLYNDFSIIAKKKYPILETLEKALLSFGAIGVSLTGKGPTVFGIFQTKKDALQAKKILQKYYPQFLIELF